MYALYDRWFDCTIAKLILLHDSRQGTFDAIEQVIHLDQQVMPEIKKLWDKIPPNLDFTTTSLTVL